MNQGQVAAKQRCKSCGASITAGSAECWICGAAVSSEPGMALVPVSMALVPVEDRPYRYIDEEDDGDDVLARANRPSTSRRALVPSWSRDSGGALPRSKQPDVVPPFMPAAKTPLASQGSTLAKVSKVILIIGIAAMLIGSITYLLIPESLLRGTANPADDAPGAVATPPAAPTILVPVQPVVPAAEATATVAATGAPATAAPVATEIAAPAPTATVAPATATSAPSATPEPTAQPTELPTLVPTEALTPTVAAVADQTYIVQRGDTCSRIATAFGVTVAELIQINQLADNCPLRPDQQLIIPAGAQRTPARPAAPAPTRPAAETPAASPTPQP
jgi:LysM repeat protein